MNPHAHHHSDHSHKATAGGCSGHAPKAHDLAAAQADEVTACLVMPGTPVIKPHAEQAGLYRDYQGQRYWLCCDTCGSRFDAEPGRYATAV